MQSRALVARVSSATKARCASLTALVGVLMTVTFHVQHHGSSCALSIYQRAPHELEHLALISRVFSLTLRLCFETILVSAGALLSSLPTLCISSLIWFLVSARDFSQLCSCGPDLLRVSASPLLRSPLLLHLFLL